MQANKKINMYSIMIAIMVIVFDQLSKYWVMKYFTNDISKLVINSFFNIMITFNYGVSFGMFPANSKIKYCAILLVSAILLWIVIWWWRKAIKDLEKIACSLVIGGALGNIIDRLRFHAVVDFLDFHINTFHWPAFNLADSAIVLGVGLLMVGQICGCKKSA